MKKDKELMARLESLLTTARMEGTGTAPLRGTPATPAGQVGNPTPAPTAQGRVVASQAAGHPRGASSSQGIAPVASSSRAGVVTGQTINNPQIIEENGRTYANLS